MQEEKIIVWFNVKEAASLWIAEVVTLKSSVLLWQVHLKSWQCEPAYVHIGSAQADFCTLLFLGRMLFIAKELEDDSSNIGMIFSSLQYSFCSENNVFEHISY